MPEPRETHAAIDARRDTQRGGGDREALARLLEQHPAYSTGNDQQDWFKALEAADAILAAGWVPEHVVLEEIDKRDRLEEVADQLAYAIAPQSVIGEHSSANNPWANALAYRLGERRAGESTGRPCGCVWCCQATNPWIRGKGHRHCAGHPLDVARAALAPSDPATDEHADEAFERDVLASEAADREVP